jgi:hypothetical protein
VAGGSLPWPLNERERQEQDEAELLMSAGHDPDAAETRDARFEFGLDWLPDRIAARIGSSAGDG